MKGTPPAAVIYHAMPYRAVHTYTTMMIHGGGKAGRRLSLVLIDVIDIGIRRRADYSAVNNSTPPSCCRCCSLLPRPVALPDGVPAATLLPPPLRKHHLSPRSFRELLPSVCATHPDLPPRFTPRLRHGITALTPRCIPVSALQAPREQPLLPTP